MPCRNCPAYVWPAPDGDDQAAGARLAAGVWQDRDGAIHCRAAGDGHSPSCCGPDCGLVQQRHRPIRVHLGGLTGHVTRIEPGAGEADGWLVAPDDGAPCFWTPAGYAHVLDDSQDAHGTEDAQARGDDGGTPR